MTPERLSQISALVFLMSFVPFIISIVRGYRPPMTSWLIWAACDTLVTWGLREANQPYGQILAASVGAWVVFFLLLYYQTAKSWTWKQTGYVSVAAVGIILWKLMGDSKPGIIAGCLVIFIGSFETFVDAWKTPEHHTGFLSRVAWSLCWISCLPALAAVESWKWGSLIGWAQPVTFMVIETTVMYLIVVRPQFVRVHPRNPSGITW